MYYHINYSFLIRICSSTVNFSSFFYVITEIAEIDIKQNHVNKGGYIINKPLAQIML